MPYLDIPGAKLYYETQGQGPLLVLVPAANGDTTLYEAVALHLAERYAVCVYDRRRFSRSKQTEDHDYQGAERLARDADDLELLVKHLQPDRPALIYGSSSGGVVSLEYMGRHAGSVAGVIVHEAPVATLLEPAFAQAVGMQIQTLYGEYLASGKAEGVLEWFLSVFNDEDKHVLTTYWDASEHQANLKFWIDRELAGYPGLETNVKVLKQNHQRLVVGLSKEMSESYLGMIARNLSEQTGAPLVTLPYGHMGYQSHPKEFAAALMNAFEGRFN